MKKTWILIGLVIFAVIGFITVREIQKPQQLKSRATAKNAKIFLLPSQVHVSGEQTLQLWVTSDAPIVFARVEVAFNASLIKLSQAITLINSALSTTVSLTSPETANTAGKIAIVIAKDPTSSYSPPTGTFQIATIKILPNTTQLNSTTIIDIDTANSQLVATDSSEFTLTKGAANITVNPPVIPTVTSTPTRTPTPTITPTITPTRTPTPTITPTITPTRTPTPTCIPLPSCVYNPPIVNGIPMICDIAAPPDGGRYCPGPTLTLTPSSTPIRTPTATLSIVSIPGDANSDGKVDGIDYTIWFTHYDLFVSGFANGDFNNNGVVNGVDYAIWFNNYSL